MWHFRQSFTKSHSCLQCVALLCSCKDSMYFNYILKTKHACSTSLLLCGILNDHNRFELCSVSFQTHMWSYGMSPIILNCITRTKHTVILYIQILNMCRVVFFIEMDQLLSYIKLITNTNNVCCIIF